jgi:hypothetical protein
LIGFAFSAESAHDEKAAVLDFVEWSYLNILWFSLMKCLLSPPRRQPSLPAARTRAQTQKAMIDPIASAIITVSHKAIAQIDSRYVETEI